MLTKLMAPTPPGTTPAESEGKAPIPVQTDLKDVVELADSLGQLGRAEHFAQPLHALVRLFRFVLIQILRLVLI